MRQFFTLATIASILISSAVQGDASKISFPSDYDKRFSNYLSLDRTQNPDQIIRLFANEIALRGPAADGKLAYGSILVAEIYKAKKDANGELVRSSLGRLVRDKKALVAIMQREPGWGSDHPTGLKNGNWEFAAFKPDGTDAKKDLNVCRACHAPLTASNHLFSMEHLSN